MNKEIKVVDKKTGIVQITTSDERWYAKNIKNKTTGLPEYTFVPSVTWIASKYPKGIAFYKWIASKGWDEAQSIKEQAGEKGDTVHKKITEMIAGKEVKFDDVTVEEYEALVSFKSWFDLVKPHILENEIVVWGDRYAGTVDIVCTIDGQKYIIDVKTSKYIWPEYELQISAYKHAMKDKDDYKLAILQVGYDRNKMGYKFTDIDDKFALFNAAYLIWQNEHGGEKPKQKDYPLTIKLATDEKATA